MALSIELSISDDVDQAALPAEETLQHWAEASYLEDDEAVASLQIVSSDEMQVLNRDYRGKDSRPMYYLSPWICLRKSVSIFWVIWLCATR